MQILDNNIPTGDTEEDFNSQVVRANGKVGLYLILIYIHRFILRLVFRIHKAKYKVWPNCSSNASCEITS